jgi:CheY-like chemotaxis protein
MGKLLIVDDDEAVRRLMRLELSDTYEIIDTGEPEQGLALALENKPDAILIDLRMPKYSGYQLLETFTSFSRTQTTPVIVVSGEGGAQTKEDCKRLGAAAYFEKPIDFEALRSGLQQIVKSRRHPPRNEVRVQLRVALKLRGTDIQGNKFDDTATTDDVSISGFQCACAAELAMDSIVDVYLVSYGDKYVGKAKIMHAGTKKENLRHYGCRFTEKTGPWTLQ